MRNFFSKFFCPHFIDLEISLFCKQTGPRYVNKWLKQISLPFLYSPWIVETPELCYKKWPDFYLKLSRSISVNTLLLLDDNLSFKTIKSMIVLLYHIFFSIQTRVLTQSVRIIIVFDWLHVHHTLQLAALYLSSSRSETGIDWDW